MCNTCVYIYIRIYTKAIAKIQQHVSSCRKAHLSVHYGVIWFISRQKTRIEYVLFYRFRIRSGIFCFRFSVSSLDLSFLPDRVCFFFRSRFYANSHYTKITRYRIRAEGYSKKIKKESIARPCPGYFVRATRIIGESQIFRYTATPVFSRHSCSSRHRAIGQRQIVSSLKYFGFLSR